VLLLVAMEEEKRKKWKKRICRKEFPFMLTKKRESKANRR
jgi:hypothetical protein